jgi:hypothetical protein
MSGLDTSPILITAASGDASALREELRSRALSSLYYFSKVVMNFSALSASFHLSKCQEIQDSIWMQRRGFLWPRAHFKSTIITKSYVLWRLAGGGWEKVDYSDPNLDPRNRRWMLIGEADDRVTAAVKNIKWHLENNQMLKWLFPEIIPEDTNKTTWRDDAILLPRTEGFDEPTIKAVGIGAKVTGYHGDGFVFDDVIGEKAAKSEADMRSANDWLAYWPGLVNDWAYVEQIFAGTRWKHGTADSYGLMMENEPFQVGEDKKPSGVKWFAYSAIVVNDKDETVPAFPERFSISNLNAIRAQQRDYRFSCQYLNTPSTPEGADFPAAQIQTYRIETDSDGKANTLIPLDGTPPVRLGQLYRISFLDPSSGGRSAECENALIALGTASDGRQFVLKALMKNCGYRAIIEHWHELNDKFLCYRNYYEAVGAQKTLEEFITERQLYKRCNLCEKTHRKLIPIGVKPPGGTMNKEDRIRNFLQPTVEEGKLYLHESMFTLRQQITSFPHAKLVDGLDALAYAVNKSVRPSSEQEIQEERQETEEAMTPHISRIKTAYSYGGYA